MNERAKETQQPHLLEPETSAQDCKQRPLGDGVERDQLHPPSLASAEERLIRRRALRAAQRGLLLGRYGSSRDVETIAKDLETTELVLEIQSYFVGLLYTQLSDSLRALRRDAGVNRQSVFSDTERSVAPLAHALSLLAHQRGAPHALRRYLRFLKSEAL